MMRKFMMISRRYIKSLFVETVKSLGEFFIKETKDMINQLCDDFEKAINGKFQET